MMKKRRLSGLIFFLLCWLNVSHNLDTRACDTWVAVKGSTQSGFTILAKNSDRTLFDCQPLLFHPRQTWKKDAEINLGRINIPQVTETYATLGSSPYWCWGYEEGINEFGVAIGNEGIFTRVLADEIQAHSTGNGPQSGPTGMDLLRLGLERGKTALEALKVITGLVEKYGQFGSGIPTMGVDGAYHNSFIIADPNESWILETAGTLWIAKKFSEGVTSISNTISIEDEWDLASDSLITHAVDMGWWDQDDVDNFDFSEAYSDDAVQRRMQGRRALVRANRSCGLLEDNEGQIDTRWMMRIARDRSSTPSIDLDQTASSCVAILPHMEKSLPVFWWTPSVPSSGCYVPFFVHGSQIPEVVSRAGTAGRKIAPPSQVVQDEFADDSYWWLFRDLTDLVNEDWKRRNTIVRYEWDQLEKTFEAELPEIIEQAVALRNSGKIKEAAGLLDGYTTQCVAKVMNKVNALREQFRNEVTEIPDEFKPYVGKYTADQNRILTVTVQNNHLAVDIPGQMIFELNDPDEEGLRTFKITPLVSIGFNETGGKVTDLLLNQTTQFPKKAEPEAIPDNVPQEYRPYLGPYTIATANLVLTIFYEEGHLALDIPNQARSVLNPPDEEGLWTLQGDRQRILSFDRDSAGKVTGMNVHQHFVIPRGMPISNLIEEVLGADGLEAAVTKFHEYRKSVPEDYFFNENGFNDLGYKLLGEKKFDEAIAIFKLNVESYPDSWNVYDSLGEAYMKNGDKELAIQNYKKSLELNPENEAGRKMLEQLQSEK